VEKPRLREKVPGGDDLVAGPPPSSQSRPGWGALEGALQVDLLTRKRVNATYG